MWSVERLKRVYRLYRLYPDKPFADFLDLGHPRGWIGLAVVEHFAKLADLRLRGVCTEASKIDIGMESSGGQQQSLTEIPAEVAATATLYRLSTHDNVAAHL